MFNASHLVGARQQAADAVVLEAGRRVEVEHHDQVPALDDHHLVALVLAGDVRVRRRHEAKRLRFAENVTSESPLRQHGSEAGDDSRHGSHISVKRLPSTASSLHFSHANRVTSPIL